MSQLSPALAYVLYWENTAFENDPDDPGGPTKYGITIQVLKELGLGGDIDHDGDIDLDDIRSLDPDTCRTVYNLAKWNKAPFSKIADQEVATKYFDTAVNLGIHEASLILQRAINISEHMHTRLNSPVIKVDGVVGPRTLGALHCVDPAYQTLLTAMCSEQAGIYRIITQKKPSLVKFLAGWLRRAYSVPMNMITSDWTRL